MKQQLKNIAKQAVRRIAQEPLEILKESKEQITGTIPPEVKNRPPQPEVKTDAVKKNAQANRLYSALQNEIKEIQAKEKQKQAERNVQPENAIPKDAALVEPATKRSRRLFGFGQKAQAEKQKTHVERPVQSST